MSNLHEMFNKVRGRYKEAYDQGKEDAKAGLEYRGDELYPPSGHERDTTYQDELGYAYYEGYYS